MGTVTDGPDLVRVEDVAWIRIEADSGPGVARRAAVDLAERLGLPEQRVAEIGIVATEVAGNIAKHGGGGAFALRACRSLAGAGLCFVGLDSGPGIPDIDAAMRDGYSTTGTLGIGLGALARLADSFDVFSLPDRGAVVVARFGECVVASPTSTVAALRRPMPGEEMCGDNYAVRLDGEVLTVALADGLGHGPLAAAASEAALRGFLDSPFTSAAGLLTAADRAANGTRGAAMAVAQIATGGAISFAGLGNIAARVYGDDKTRGLVSYPGIVGTGARSVRELPYELPSDGVLALHTDGISERAALNPIGGLLRQSADVIAAVVMRDHGVRNDDAGVLVVRSGPRE